MRQFVIELHDYRFIWEVKIKESEAEEEIPTMIKDKDQDGVDEKTEEKMEDVSKLQVLYKIGGKEEIETIVV